MSFRWVMGDWAGGSTAVHQAYKTYLCMRPEAWAGGEFLVQPRDTSDIVIDNLGFRPTVLFLISYRPTLANGTSDSSFAARGGGMTYGVAGYPTGYVDWDSATTYDPGDVVRNDGVLYSAVNQNTNDEPPSANWTSVPFAQFTGSSKMRHAFSTSWKLWREDRCFSVAHQVVGTQILHLDLASFDADGFTLNVPTNLYDQTDYVAYLAMAGNFQVGVINAGDTSITGFSGTPKGAVFLSSRMTAPGTANQAWDHVQGFAAELGEQVCIWGGSQPTAWGWSTERWRIGSSILICTPASWSGFTGASVTAAGSVSAWNPGGVDLQWLIYSGVQHRIGYVLAGDPSESGYLETNWQTRPGGTQNTPPGSGENFEVTTLNPKVILMAATNYNFSYSNTNPFDDPRVANSFWPGGSGGLGWHFAPFSLNGYDAYGVHTFDNAVQERGHYQNSGTQYLRRYILAGQGANSQPPAFHQHSVNVIENPVIVGLNYRYGERHAHRQRLHVNPSDT